MQKCVSLQGDLQIFLRDRGWQNLLDSRHAIIQVSDNSFEFRLFHE